jgi:regulator of replication initiation timing
MQLEQKAVDNGGQLDMVASLQKQVMALTTQKAALSGELKVLQQGDVQENAALGALELENTNLKMALAQTKADMAVMSEQQKSLELAASESGDMADAHYQEALAQKTGVIDALSGENNALKDQLDQVQMLLVSQNITSGEQAVAVAKMPAPVDDVTTEAFPISEVVVEKSGLTQAQRDEFEMKARMKSEQMALDAQAFTPPPAPLELRQAEDQLAGFNTIEQDGRVVNAAASAGKTLSKPRALVDAVVYQAALPVPELLAVVNPRSQAKLVEKNSGPGQVAYQWTSDEIYGSAEQQPLASAYQFDGKVQEYLERTQKRCPGDFAIVPDGSFERGNIRVDSYDVACIGAGVSSSAALLFYNDAGTFTAFAHEAPTERLDDAIESRERIVNAVVSGS